MAYPFIWKFIAPVTIEIFVTTGDVSYGVYNSYIMIEEFEKINTNVGKDRLTDPAL